MCRKKLLNIMVEKNDYSRHSCVAFVLWHDAPYLLQWQQHELLSL